MSRNPPGLTLAEAIERERRRILDQDLPPTYTRTELERRRYFARVRRRNRYLNALVVLVAGVLFGLLLLAWIDAGAGGGDPAAAGPARTLDAHAPAIVEDRLVGRHPFAPPEVRKPTGPVR